MNCLPDAQERASQSGACWPATPHFSSRAERQSDSIHLVWGGLTEGVSRKSRESHNPGVTHKSPTMQWVLQLMSLIFP